jgi:hypothetical protein
MSTPTATIDRPIMPPRLVEGHYFAAQFPQPPGPDGDPDVYIDTYRPVVDPEDARLLAYWEAVHRILNTIKQDLGPVEQLEPSTPPTVVPEAVPERVDPLPVGQWREVETPARKSRLHRLSTFILSVTAVGAAASLTKAPSAWNLIRRPLHPLVVPGQKVLESVWDKVGSDVTHAAVGVGVLAIAAVGAKWWRKSSKTGAAEVTSDVYLQPEPIPAGSQQLS